MLRRTAILGATLVALVSTPPTAAHTPDVSLSGTGKATIDGVLSGGEWDNAASADFILTTLPGESHQSTVRVMNDGTYLYLAVLIRDDDFKMSSFGVQGDILTVFFDNDHDGGIAFTGVEQNDDFVQAQLGFLDFFVDAFRCFPALCGFETWAQDVDFGGTRDADAAVGHTVAVDGAVGDYTYEVRKKLASGDTHDFGVAAGDTLGFFLYFVDTPVGSNGGVPAAWPGPASCTAAGAAVPCVGADLVVAAAADTPPVLNTPGHVVAEAAGPDGASVAYDVTAVDDIDPTPLVTCEPASGTVFPLGNTTVECVASDESGNSSAASFIVSVVDTTAPAATASLVRVLQDDDDDEDGGRLFRVVANCEDLVDGQPALTATLNGIAVSPGQVVRLILTRHDGQAVRGRRILTIKAQSFELAVACVDASGNAGHASAVPTFVDEDD